MYINYDVMLEYIPDLKNESLRLPDLSENQNDNSKKDYIKCKYPDNYFSKIEESILACVSRETISVSAIRDKLTKYLNKSQKEISRGTVAPALNKLERYELIYSEVKEVPRKSGKGVKKTKFYSISKIGLKKYLEQKSIINELETPLSI